MKIHALEWGAPQLGMPPLTIQEPPGTGSNPAIGKVTPHYTSAVATAGSTSLRPVLGGWAANIRGADKLWARGTGGL